MRISDDLENQAPPTRKVSRRRVAVVAAGVLVLIALYFWLSGGVISIAHDILVQFGIHSAALTFALSVAIVLPPGFLVEKIGGVVWAEYVTGWLRAGPVAKTKGTATGHADRLVQQACNDYGDRIVKIVIQPPFLEADIHLAGGEIVRYSSDGQHVIHEPSRWKKVLAKPHRSTRQDQCSI